MSIKLKTETEDQLVDSVRRYWKQEEDEDLGELRARMFVKFLGIYLWASRKKTVRK